MEGWREQPGPEAGGVKLGLFFRREQGSALFSTKVWVCFAKNRSGDRAGSWVRFAGAVGLEGRGEAVAVEAPIRVQFPSDGPGFSPSVRAKGMEMNGKGLAGETSPRVGGIDAIPVVRVAEFTAKRRASPASRV
ncbi:MAG: hypothetical protein AAB403_00865, partial [Planctomycetota bacterium]